MQHARRSTLLLLPLLLAACGGLGSAGAERPVPTVVVVVKFKSRFGEDEIRTRYPKRMPAFRALPGLVQKYYLYDPQAQEWAGIYFWDSMASVEDYLRSDLKQSIPEAYGVVGQPRVEVMQLVDTLR